MPFCTNCGHDNPDGSNFCGQCGAALGVPAAAGSSAAQLPDAAERPSGDTTHTFHPVVEDRDADALSPEDEAAVSALPAGSALLVVQRGESAGSRFLLNTESSTVGRHAGSDIFLDDISVSRRHAVFERTPRGTVVRDSGSLNGTYVNRDLVDELLLQDGDEVQIGKFRLVFYGSTQG
jgi:hypothetical protein